VRTDVLIIGAGPAGLTLAALLAEHGVDFQILDGKSGPVDQSRAALVHVRTLELLDRLGLAETAVARGVKTTTVEIYEQGKRAASFPLAGRGAAAAQHETELQHGSGAPAGRHYFGYIAGSPTTSAPAAPSWSAMPRTFTARRVGRA
jgi:2-polyprenyl-6-methoxyphenol hydroxylase-like FAD-dependent oxidoreductase